VAMLLTRELPPTRSSLTGAVALTAIVGAASLALAMQCSPRAADAPVGDVVVVTTVPPGAERDADPASVVDYALLIRAGTTTYMQIAGDAARALARPDAAHRGVVLREDQAGIVMAIAPVELFELPSELRDLHGGRVVVHDPRYGAKLARCEATITGFAIVSRLVGSPEYAGVDGPWTAESVFEHGARTLAAELSACEGQYARAAHLPPLVHATDHASAALSVEDELAGYAIEMAARARLLASPPAALVQQEWTEYRDSLRRYHEDDEEDDRERWYESEDAEIEVWVMKHPTTKATWALARARLDGGCGLPEANLVALYEVMSDGELAEVSAFASELTSIDDVIDIDNDGRFELVGKDWLGNTVVARDSGTTIDKLDVAFWACGC
jgi:hypothetical protein